jgi:glycosidase
MTATLTERLGPSTTERLTSVDQLDFTPRGDAFKSPRDWRDQFIYQLLIDRFDDAQDHPPYDPGTAPRGRDASTAGCFQGGKIKGVTRRLDYIKGLGCTTIWLSPPFKNRQDCNYSCHGYGIQDFLAIDPRFGTLEDLQELVREAHARGMYVVLDIIINHTGDVWGYPNNESPPFDEGGTRYDFGFWRRCGENGREDLGPDDAVWPTELQDPDCFTRRGHIRDMGCASLNEAINGDFFSLKDLDLSNPKVVDVMIKCYKHWIAVADIDGYRIDTVKHAHPEGTAIFCNAIREYARSIGKDNFILFGEVVDNDEMIRKYIASNTPVEGEAERYPFLDACLDFPLYFVLEEVIKGHKPPEDLRLRYEHFQRFYRDFGQAGQYFVTFIDNHDQMCRPFRRFMHGVQDPKVGVLGLGFLLSNLGIPCIYYGTEQGFDGAGPEDTFVRETMFGGAFGAFDTHGVHFFNEDNPIYQGIAKVARIRAEERTLRYGREYFREISGDGIHFGHPQGGHCTLAFSRVLDTQEILVCLNIDASDRNDAVAVDGKLTPAGSTVIDLMRGREFPVEQTDEGTAFVKVPLKGHEMAILKKAQS